MRSPAFMYSSAQKRSKTSLPYYYQVTSVTFYLNLDHYGCHKNLIQKAICTITY